MPTQQEFTIGVLLYGDYPKLAERCLRSIVEQLTPGTFQIRVGLNEVSPIVREWVHAGFPPECIYESAENIHKYPMLRRMLYERPVETPYFMWFDDDSYLASGTPADWLTRVSARMDEADLIGSIYHVGWKRGQKEWVKRQPWYGGKDPADRGHIRFITGGWWSARTEVLYKLDYPWKELDHRGGDTMLGEACHQQSLRIRPFKEHLHINADDEGRESKSPRRGFDQQPIGAVADTPAAALHRATSPGVILT